MEQKEKHFSLSWFFKWFLDNKAITVFLVTLLLGLNLFILSKISFLFSPVLDFLAVVMLPVILSGLLYPQLFTPNLKTIQNPCLSLDPGWFLFSPNGC
ncbi:hypothetical protein ACRE0A_10720, partial [Streptococcus pneumoniae]